MEKTCELAGHAGPIEGLSLLDENKTLKSAALPAFVNADKC